MRKEVEKEEYKVEYEMKYKVERWKSRIGGGNRSGSIHWMGGSRCNDLVESFTFTIMIVMVLMIFYGDFYDLFSDDFEAFLIKEGRVQ